MIRKSTFSLKSANHGKIRKLDLLMDESIRVVNLYIDELWKKKPSRFVNFKVDTWLSARMQQCLGKQASEVVKSVRAKKRGKKSKPVLSRPSINLDSRFVDIRFDENSFDVWVKLSSIGNRMSLRLPSKKHVHFNGLISSGFELKKSARLRRSKNGYEIDLYLEREEQTKHVTGNVVGVDCGYKKLIVDSSGTIYDDDLESVYEKISRKKQGSRSFKRALVERDNLINQSLNKIKFDGVLEIVAEDLNGVKTGTKGKISKDFNNKLQRWSYPKVLGKLSRMCEERGVFLTKVNPAYTSQKCSLCGATHKESRKGESYRCVVCGMEMDADHNAAINISRMGVYSLHAI